MPRRNAGTAAPVSIAPIQIDEESPFAGTNTTPAAPAPVIAAATPAPVDAQALLAKLTQLNRDVAAADRERAAAAAQLAQAQKDLAEIDGHLKAMGVEPETAEDALATLEQELLALATQFEAAVATERAVYEKIAAAQS